MDPGWKKAMWAAITSFVLTAAFVAIRVLRTSWADVPDELYLKGVAELMGTFGTWWMGTPDKPKEGM